MPDKPRPVKKKTKASAPRAVPAPSPDVAKTRQRKTTFHVRACETTAVVTRQQPAGPARAGQFATFKEAQSAGLDVLVAAIEDLEQQLLALKRASSYEQFAASAGD